MSRLIVSLDSGVQPGEILLRLEDTPPPEPDGMDMPVLFPLPAPPKWTGVGAVRAHGTLLHTALLQQEAVAEVLDRLQKLQTAPGVAPCPLYFRLRAPGVEQSRWEALFENSFYALQSTSPIARIASGGTSDHRPARVFRGPLRLAVVISALRIESDLQWDELDLAVTGARAAGLDVELLVLAGQPELLDVLAPRHEAGVLTVRPLPGTPAEIRDALTDFRPHLLHVFCHGHADHVPRLELATQNDWRTPGLASGSVLLTQEELRGWGVLQETWLVVLACCDGARPTDNSDSLARDLVRVGVPAVVGIQDPLEQIDAAALTRALYPRVFRLLRQQLATLQPDTEVTLDWAPVLHDARVSLSARDGAPDDDPVWTAPALYVRPEPLHVRLAPPAQPGPVAGFSPEEIAGLLRQAHYLAGALRALPPPSDAESEPIRAYLLLEAAKLPAPFRPGPDGTFPGSDGPAPGG